jgi:hypothetical protein
MNASVHRSSVECTITDLGTLADPAVWAGHE